MTNGTISITVGIILLILLKILFKDKNGPNQNKRQHRIEYDDLIKEEPEFDRTWSFLPNNIFHRSNDD